VSNDDIMGFSPLNAVERLDGRPIYITHGTLDDRIRIEYAEDLVAAAKAAGSTPETWFVPCGHTKSMLDEPVEYERRLAEFFDQTVGG
jgi:fermentation-respiration switch protein FrsA (DUF1100 family)